MELLVYKASAGSGKTFTLAVKYIRHLMLNPHAYRQILAVTFTNKATGEMKERIIQQLYGIWIGDPASEPYLKRLQTDLDGMAAEELRKRAGIALQYMLHDYSRFRVETIDSFFQSVMRNLARELGLSPNLNIELNSQEVLGDAVDSLIEKLTPDSPVLAWLLDYIHEQIADDKRWNVSQEIKNFGTNIFDENYIERGAVLRRQLQEPHYLKQYRDLLRTLLKEAQEEMHAYYERFMELLESHNLFPEELSGGAGNRNICNYFTKLRDGRLSDKDALSKTLENHLLSAGNWAAKGSERREEIVDLAERMLLPLLQEAEEARQKNNRTINSCRLSLRNLNTLRLLNHIDEEVRTLNHEHNRFLLSDTTALLHSLMREGDSSFVFEKIGAQIRNVMIDEFQDTSRMQWDNFRLLLLEGLSQGADSLIVGDVKQSIYRWRNGDWGILNSLGTSSKMENGKMENGNGIHTFPIRVETLKTNRRSETNVIDFNNRLFTEAVRLLNEKHLQELHEECEPLKRAYADVVQQSPKEEKRGYVKATFLQPDEKLTYTEQTLQALGDEVNRLLDAGVRLNDIAILVRKNKYIPLIAGYFSRELQLSVVSDEAFRLDASQAVCLLMDALRWLSNPEDKVSEKRCFDFAQHDNSSPSDNSSFTIHNSSFIIHNSSFTIHNSSFIIDHSSLKTLPLYELLEELYNLLDLKRIPGQDAYLFSFFDAVTEYLQNNSSELGGFIRHWEETLCKKTISGGEVEGIRIFSIHKSKGLEFHTVLVPFCDWDLEHANDLLWCSSDVEPYNALSLVPVNFVADLADSVYRNDYLHERLQQWVDNLNILYVALTRAGSNLILWSNSKKGREINPMSQLLLKALPQVADAEVGTWDSEALVYEHGVLCPSESADKDKTEKPGFINRLTQKPERMSVNMQSARPGVEFLQSNRSADFIAGVEEGESWRRFINRGKLLHTLFSAIETEADIDPAIDRLLFEGVIADKEMEAEIRTLTRRAFSLPQVKDWYSGRWRLFNECDIIWQENGTLHNRRPDRVMMRDGEIVVVDFKFGKPQKRYNRQVQGYMELLKRMYVSSSPIISGYLWYVEEERMEKV